MNENIKKLQEQIHIEQQKIARCSHSFGEPFYDPKAQRIPADHIMVGHGSDVYYESQGYKDVVKDRWSRVCKNCGLIEHTYTQEPVITKYQPKF